MLALPTDQQERQLTEWKRASDALGQLPFDDIAIVQWAWGYEVQHPHARLAARRLRAWYD